MASERFQLPEADLRAALRRWPVPEPFEVEAIAVQIGSDCWHLHCADGKRWVAKFAYDRQDAFDVGLQLGELINSPDLLAPMVLRAHEGRLSELVEGPPGHWHPLGVMTYVPGLPVEIGDEMGPSIIGSTLAEFHRRLAHSDRWVPVTSDGLIPYLENDGWDLLERAAVREVIREALIATRRAEADMEVTRGVIALDGLEVLSDAGRLGIVDFHTVTWGSLMFDLGEAARAFEDAGADFTSFLTAYQSNSPLRSEELALLPVYRDLAVAWRLRVAAWYALREGLSTRWRDETYRLLKAARRG